MKKINYFEFENNIKFLDEILRICLQEGDNYQISTPDLEASLNDIDLNSLVKKDIFKRIKSVFKKNNNKVSEVNILELQLRNLYQDKARLYNALNFLEEEKLILHNSNIKININIVSPGIVTLTFKGIIKLSRGGFYGDHIRQKRKDLLQSFFWLVAVLTFLAGIIVPFLSKLYTI